MSKSKSKDAAKRRAAKRHRRDVVRRRSQPASIPRDADSPIFAGYEPPEEQKLSNRVLQLAEPLLDHCETDTARHNAVVLAVLAWNEGVDPRLDAETAMTENFRDQVGEDKEGVRETLKLVDRMVRVKRKRYPDDRRIVADYHLSVSGGDIRLYVAHLVDPTGTPGGLPRA